MSHLVNASFAYGTLGNSSAPLYPLSFVHDGNPATVADFPGVAGQGYTYLIIDMLAPRLLDRIVLRNVSVIGGQAGVAFTCAIDISDVYSVNGIPGDTPGGHVFQLLCQTNQQSPVTGVDLVFVPIPGVPVQGRYAYVSFTSNSVTPPAPPTVTIGEAAAYAIIPVPVLTAVGSLVNNVPEIDLLAF